MENCKDNFKSKHYYKDPYDHKYPSSSHRENYKRYAHLETKHESQYCNGYDRDHFQASQSTLRVPHRGKNTSKSTLSTPFHHVSPSKSTLCYTKKITRPMIDKDVSNLPYYIVPVLYVPHKAMYEAKQILEPNIYKAYHCRSKNQLHKDTKIPPKLSRSKSMLDLNNKIHRKEHDCSYLPKNEKYSFECYDEYFRKYIEEKNSSSDISFCTDKSYSQLPLTPKLSSKFTDEPLSPASEKRKSISKDFPELFGFQSSKTTACTFGPRTGVEEPTWDSPRTTDAFIETETAVKGSISAQTSFDTLKWRVGRMETQGTQTIIKDIKKNVLVLPNDRFKSSTRRESITEEVPRTIYDGKVLNAKFSEGQLDKITRNPFGFNRSSPRFAKSAVSNSFGSTIKSSRRSMDSETTSKI